MAENKAEFTADLLLWRHADAEDGMPDSGRALTKKGLRQAKQVAQWLKPRLPGDCNYAALARCVVDRFSPTMKDGFTVDIVRI